MQIRQKILAVVGCLAVAAMPYFLQTGPAISLICMFLAIYAAGVFSGQIVDEVYAIRASQQPPPQVQPEYEIGTDVKILVNDSDDQAAIIRMRATQMNGVVKRAGERRFIVVGNIAHPIRVIYQSVAQGESAPSFVEPTQSAQSTSFTY